MSKKHPDVRMDNVLYRWFSFKKLGVVRKYQRPLDKAHVKRILKHYHPDLNDPPLVCILRNGELHVCNGQHSIEAFKDANPQATGRYCVVTQLKPDEAFILKNTNNKTVSGDQRFWISYGCNRSTPLAIERICKKYGIVLQKPGPQKPGHCQRVHRLQQYYVKYGANKFEKCIKLLAQCFRAVGSRTRVQDSALQSAFLVGFMNFAGTDAPRDFAKIKRTLKDARWNSDDILSKAFEISNSGARYAAIEAVLNDICNV